MSRRTATNCGWRGLKNILRGGERAGEKTVCIVGISYRISYSIVRYLYVSFSGLITSVLKERANISAIVYLLLCDFCLEDFLVSFVEQYPPCIPSRKWLLYKLLRSKITKCIFAFVESYQLSRHPI